MEIKAGDYIRTPRFTTVRIEKVFNSVEAAYEEGYKEPTHFKDEEYMVLGKSLDMYHMRFCAVKK